MKFLLFPLAGAVIGYYLSERGGVGIGAVIGALATIVFTLAGAGIGLLASLAIAGSVALAAGARCKAVAIKRAAEKLLSDMAAHFEVNHGGRPPD